MRGSAVKEEAHVGGTKWKAGWDLEARGEQERIHRTITLPVINRNRG